MPSEQQLSEVLRDLARALAIRMHGARRRAAVVLTVTATIAGAVLLVVGSDATAANPLTVPMGTAANYSVLGEETVTNTGLSILDSNVGLSPGTSITGFPPGVVTPPAMVGPANDAAAIQAQTDLGTAYTNAAARAVDVIEPSDLGTLGGPLPAGVYASADGAFLLTGTLVLDGGNDPSSVFIFKAASTITTASNSVVTLINGAQECNVFWQIGSSATLGTGSDFAGNILANTSITVTTGVSVRGRALAHGAAVTLDTNRFTVPTCALEPPPTTTEPPTTVLPTTTVPAATTTVLPTTTVPAATTTVLSTTTAPAAPTTTTAPAAPTTTLPATAPTTSPDATTTVVPAATTTTAPNRGDTSTTVGSPSGGGSDIVVGPPRTGGGPSRRGSSSWPEGVVLAALVGAGVIGLVVRLRAHARV